jgi:hypothetical protein
MDASAVILPFVFLPFGWLYWRPPTIALLLTKVNFYLRTEKEWDGALIFNREICQILEISPERPGGCVEQESTGDNQRLFFKFRTPHSAFRGSGNWGTKDEATAEAESVPFVDVIVLIFMTFMRTESRGATVDAN